MTKSFTELSEREILALAISLEEEDGRIYGDFADGLRESYPATAKVLEEMQAEESHHRASLLETYRQRFGEHIPLIRRQDIKGFIRRRPIWLVRPLGIHAVRKQVEIMELETRRFYERAGAAVSDASVRKLLGDLADAERKHSAMAESLEKKYLTPAPLLPPCSRLRLRPEIAGTLSWWGWLPPSELASPWGLLKPFPTTAPSRGADIPGSGALSAG